MSDNHSPDITTGFIQMVEAFKAKPELESKIKELEAALESREQEARRMENKIHELGNNLDVASQDKERLTRERDEAMFRTLELEEKTSAVNDLLAQLTRVVHPEPVAKDTHEDQGGAGSKDSVGSQAYDGGFQGLPPSGGSNVESFPRPEYSGQGQSENVRQGTGTPTSESSQDYGSGTRQDNAGSNVEGNRSEPMASSDVKDEPTTERRPNEGKPYSDKPYWVSDANWRLEGGQGPYEGGSWTAPWADRYGS